MNDAQQIHDGFFKELFSLPEIAADFLRFYLPDDLVADDAEVSLGDALRLLASEDDSNMMTHVKTLLTYFSNAHEKLTGAQMERAYLQSFTRSEGMNAIEQLQQEGFQRGQQIGIQLGSQQTLLATTLRQLRLKIGDVSTEAQEEINVLSVAQLEALSEALLGFSTQTDLETWLGQQQTQH